MPAVGRSHFSYIFLGILTVSVEKMKAEYYNNSITSYNRKKSMLLKHAPLYSGLHYMIYLHISFILLDTHGYEFPCGTGIITSLPVVCQQGLEYQSGVTKLTYSEPGTLTISCFPFLLLCSAFSFTELELLQAIWINEYFQLMLIPDRSLQQLSCPHLYNFKIVLLYPDFIPLLGYSQNFKWKQGLCFKDVAFA